MISWHLTQEECMPTKTNDNKTKLLKPCSDLQQPLAEWFVESFGESCTEKVDTKLCRTEWRSERTSAI